MEKPISRLHPHPTIGWLPCRRVHAVPATTPITIVFGCHCIRHGLIALGLPQYPAVLPSKGIVSVAMHHAWPCFLVDAGGRFAIPCGIMSPCAGPRPSNRARGPPVMKERVRNQGRRMTSTNASTMERTSPSTSSFPAYVGPVRLSSG
jgi:hypothetical protein